MINILFVDDEPNILDGLKRMLRPLRHEWQTHFANGGAEALAFLAETNVDVVVSDMRMPGMDGAQLLHEVRTRYPHVVRVILSGYSEKELIMKAVGAAHQYLSKPCDADTLRTTVKRAYTLRDLLVNERLRTIVSQLHTVPSLPTLYSDLLNELKESDPSLKRIGGIVKQDIGMTIKILQLVNSAFFGLKRHIVDAQEAVQFIGLDAISSLTLAIGVFSQFKEDSRIGKMITELWAHSSAVGVIAKAIATKEYPLAISDAYTGGLLHDIGKLVLAVNLPEQFAEVQQLVTHENLAWSDAERQVFAVSHSEIGGYLLGLWGLPSTVVEAVAFHHTPSDYGTTDYAALTAVHLANAFHNAQFTGGELTEQHYDSVYLDHLGLLEKLPLWQKNYAHFNTTAASNY